MGEKEDRRRFQKRRLFHRDGWQDGDGEWFAMCAFGCGDVVGWHTAVVHLHPIKKCDGGRYTFDNTQLVCLPCHAADGNHKTLPPKRKKRHNPNKPRRVILLPKPVSVSENIDRWERARAGREAQQECHG